MAKYYMEHAKLQFFLKLKKARLSREWSCSLPDRVTQTRGYPRDNNLPHGQGGWSMLHCL